MKPVHLLLPSLVLALAAPLATAADKPGCTDPALFPTRMPGYSLENCKGEAHAALEIFAQKGPKTRVEGRLSFVTYAYTGARGEEPAGLAVIRNYENAFTRIGGTIVSSDPQRWVNGRLEKDGREIWMQVEKGNGKIWVRTLEKGEMKQQVVADAAAMNNDLRATGRVALYGIYFDTNRSEVKPESKPALEQIARLLTQNPGLTLKVVGHTDMTGAMDANLRLSQARGEAVVQALVSGYGIAAARLKGYGVGPLAPVTTNDTEEGRAKNRRVELVKQ